MKSFFESEGTLKVVISRGIISSYEINTLNRGTLIHFSDRECGQLCSVYFNDRLIGYCKIVVIDNEFAALMEKNSSWSPDEVLHKPLLDDSEIFNTELILGKRTVSVSDVVKLTAGSIIPIHVSGSTVPVCTAGANVPLPRKVPFTNGTHATGTVTAAGSEIARGKICITEETWALEVDDVFFSSLKGIPRRDSHLPKKAQKKYYDFARPDCFSRSQIRNISLIHEFFGNYTDCNLVSVDQVNWNELKAALKDYEFMDMKKEAVTQKKLSGDYRYFLPLNGENDELEEFAKDLAQKNFNNQTMERVGVFYQGPAGKALFTDNFPETRALLEAAWRDKTRVSFGKAFYPGQGTGDFMKNFSYSMTLVVTMKKDTEEFILVYPVIYMEQILGEL